MVILPPFNFSASGFPASWAGAEVENNNADNIKILVFMALILIFFPGCGELFGQDYGRGYFTQ